MAWQQVNFIYPMRTFVYTQMFLRAGQMAELDKIRTELLTRSAITLQRHARGFVQRAAYRRMRAAAITLQVSRHRHLWMSMCGT